MHTVPTLVSRIALQSLHGLLEPEPLIEGLGMSRAELSSFVGRVPWDTYAELIERIASRLTPEEFDTFAARLLPAAATDVLPKWRAGFVDPHVPMSLIASWTHTIMLPVANVEVRVVDARTQEHVWTLQPGLRDSPSFWRCMAVISTQIPDLIGVAVERIEARPVPRGLVFRAVFAPGPTWRQRLSGAWHEVRSALRSERSFARRGDARDQALKDNQAEILRQSMALFRALEACPDPMLIVRSGVIRWANQASAAALGVEVGTALRGHALAAFSWPDERETYDGAGDPDPPTADGRSAAALPTGCVRWRRRDGTPIWIELSTPTTIQFENQPATLLTGRDITLRRAHEAALRDVERHRSEFLAMLSHELRNPLAPIRHGLSLLERAPEGSAQALTARTILTRQTGQLERLVDDLLDLTRLQRGKMTLACKPLDLADLARDVAGDHRPAFEEKGVALEVHVGPTPARVDGDRERIVQALGNLLENALRHTPPGGRVALDVTVEPGEERAHVHVSDSGEGITAEALPRIFEAFRQGRPEGGSARGGLGLGLSVVHGIAELHGGSVAASSEGPGRGSEFRLSFPGLSSPDEPVAPAQESAPSRALDAPTAARRRVLVIEDNVDAADMLCELLTLGGHDVEVRYDGLSGLERIRTAVPDVVLCDLDLPGLHGLDVARACIDDERLRSVRLLALSGCAGPADRARSAAAGFEVHLAKPIPIATLEALLQTPTAA